MVRQKAFIVRNCLGKGLFRMLFHIGLRIANAFQGIFLSVQQAPERQVNLIAFLFGIALMALDFLFAELVQSLFSQSFAGKLTLIVVIVVEILALALWKRFRVHR